MKVIVAGTRGLGTYEDLLDAIDTSGFSPISEVVSGGARGADRLGIRFAIAHAIPARTFLPDWETHGKAAGPIRNREMAEYGDALIALWDCKSRGTKNMLEEAKARGLKIHLKIIPEAA